MPKSIKKHYITVFESDSGDFICDLEFTKAQWKLIQQAAIQMFVKEALRQAVKSETSEQLDL